MRSSIGPRRRAIENSGSRCRRCLGLARVPHRAAAVRTQRRVRRRSPDGGLALRHLLLAGSAPAHIGDGLIPGPDVPAAADPRPAGKRRLGTLGRIRNRRAGEPLHLFPLRADGGLAGAALLMVDPPSPRLWRASVAARAAALALAGNPRRDGVAVSAVGSNPVHAHGDCPGERPSAPRCGPQADLHAGQRRHCLVGRRPAAVGQALSHRTAARGGTDARGGDCGPPGRAPGGRQRFWARSSSSR